VNSASEQPVVCRFLLYKWHKRYSDDMDRMRDDARNDRPII